MKHIYIFAALALASCSSPKPMLVPPMGPCVPGTILPSEGIESVRYSENIKAYPVGRYVDPNNSRVMHESHTVYRVETTAKWNLHPNSLVDVPSGPAIRIVDPAHKEAPVSDEVIAEINHQRAATQALLNQRQDMERAVQRLSVLADVAVKAGEQNAKLQQELTAMKQRLESLETELRKAPTTQSAPKLDNDPFNAFAR